MQRNREVAWKVTQRYEYPSWSIHPALHRAPVRREFCAHSLLASRMPVVFPPCSSLSLIFPKVYLIGLSFNPQGEMKGFLHLRVAPWYHNYSCRTTNC